MKKYQNYAKKFDASPRIEKNYLDKVISIDETFDSPLSP